MKSRLLGLRGLRNVNLLLVTILSSRIVTRCQDCYPLSKQSVNVNPRTRLWNARLKHMTGRTADVIRQNGSMKKNVATIVSIRRISQEVRKLAIRIDREIQRIRASSLAQDVRLGEVMKLSTNTRRVRRLLPRSSVVSRNVVRFRLKVAVGGHLSLNRYLRVIISALSNSRHLALLMFNRDVIFWNLTRRLCPCGLFRESGRNKVKGRNLTLSNLSLRIKVRIDRRTNCRIIGTIRRKRYARRYRHDRYRATSQSTQSSISNVVQLLKRRMALHCMRQGIRRRQPGVKPALFRRFVSALRVVRQIVSGRLRLQCSTRLVTRTQARLGTSDARIIVRILCGLVTALQ